MTKEMMNRGVCLFNITLLFYSSSRPICSSTFLAYYACNDRLAANSLISSMHFSLSKMFSIFNLGGGYKIIEYEFRPFVFIGFCFYQFNTFLLIKCCISTFYYFFRRTQEAVVN